MRGADGQQVSQAHRPVQAFDNHGRDIASIVLGLQEDLSGLAQSHSDLLRSNQDKTADAVHRRMNMLMNLPEAHGHVRTAEVVQCMEDRLAKLADDSHILRAIDGLGLKS